MIKRLKTLTVGLIFCAQNVNAPRVRGALPVVRALVSGPRHFGAKGAVQAAKRSMMRPSPEFIAWLIRDEDFHNRLLKLSSSDVRAMIDFEKSFGRRLAAELEKQGTFSPAYPIEFSDSGQDETEEEDEVVEEEGEYDGPVLKAGLESAVGAFIIMAWLIFVIRLSSDCPSQRCRLSFV